MKGVKNVPMVLLVAQLRGGPPPLIQTTAAISPGSSGGGLFDGEGRLVGLTTFYLEGGQSLNFAMPVEWIGEVKPGRKPVAEGDSDIELWKRAGALEAAKDWRDCLSGAGRGQQRSRKMPWPGMSSEPLTMASTVTTTPSKPIDRPLELNRKTSTPGTTSGSLTAVPATERPP